MLSLFVKAFRKKEGLHSFFGCPYRPGVYTLVRRAAYTVVHLTAFDQLRGHGQMEELDPDREERRAAELLGSFAAPPTEPCCPRAEPCTLLVLRRC